MPRRDRYDKLPHRPSDYGPAAAAAPKSEKPNAEPLKASQSAANVPTPIEQFRAATRRLRIHRLELALVWLVSAHFVFLPWALGTMHPWSQITSLALSVVSFALSLVPREYTAQHTGGSSFRLVPYPKLLRFPIFWLGLAFVLLVTVQAANAAWEFNLDHRGWWMTPKAHLAALPTGVSVPFERGGPWRMLIIYASAWLSVCAIWVGLTRRRSVQRLVTVIAINAVVLSLFGLAERITGTTKIFWFYTPSNAAFFASFIYKNHAGAYLNVALSVACGLAAWFYLRGVRRLEKSNPSGLFAFIATCIAVSVLVSYARGATFVMIAYLCVVVAAFVYHQFHLPKEARQPIVAIAMLCVFGFFLKTGLEALHSDLAWDRLRAALSTEDVSVRSREIVNHASFDMLKDHWGIGVGSGGYPFLFPSYQRHYPEIFNPGGERQFWNYAHNDILQLPIELGLPGVLLIAGCFIFWFAALLRSYAWQNPLSASVILGCLFMVGMSWGDFVFYNPAVLVTWCALWPLATLWARLEEQRARA